MQNTIPLLSAALKEVPLFAPMYLFKYCFSDLFRGKYLQLFNKTLKNMCVVPGHNYEFTEILCTIEY